MEVQMLALLPGNWTGVGLCRGGLCILEAHKLLHATQRTPSHVICGANPELSSLPDLHLSVLNQRPNGLCISCHLMPGEILPCFVILAFALQLAGVLGAWVAADWMPCSLEAYIKYCNVLAIVGIDTYFYEGPVYSLVCLGHLTV